MAAGLNILGSPSTSCLIMLNVYNSLHIPSWVLFESTAMNASLTRNGSTYVYSKFRVVVFFVAKCNRSDLAALLINTLQSEALELELSMISLTRCTWCPKSTIHIMYHQCLTRKASYPAFISFSDPRYVQLAYKHKDRQILFPELQYHIVWQITFMWPKR